jgi:hypothetical protein
MMQPFLRVIDWPLPARSGGEDIALKAVHKVVL